MQRVARAAQSIARLTVALIVLLSVPFGAHAQAPRKADPQRAPLGWDGRPVTRRCHADASDLQGLKATLIEHEKARIGFKNKIRHGVFSGGELSGGRIGSAAPASLVEMISRHLSDIQASGETAALVYDIGISGQQYALCVWLFSAKGIEAAATVPIAEQSPFRLASAATMVRSGLDVEGRSAARAPQLRLGQGVEQPTRERERASEQVTEEAWSLLMPGAIAAKLRESSAKRLLILPVSDIGFVPFAALPLGGGRLIDRFALVLLPDVEALLDLSSEARPWRSEREMRSIVVGDPDLSQDRRWNFPPLAGARSEAVEVAALVGEQPLLGQEATKTHVLDRLKASRNASLIYFATHALSDAVNPMDGSFLALAGDHLYGRDIKDLLFPNNPLVVMSACQTGLGKVFEGGTFGLVRAWYHVGAPQIVMSLWNIDDNATKDLMLEFMRRLKAGAATEFALREAMLATRQKYADPALWASVALFGLPSKASRQPERVAPRVALPQELPTPRVDDGATRAGAAGGALRGRSTESGGAAIHGLGGLGYGACAGSGSPGRRTARRDHHPGAQTLSDLVPAAQQRSGASGKSRPRAELRRAGRGWRRRRPERAWHHGERQRRRARCAPRGDVREGVGGLFPNRAFRERRAVEPNAAERGQVARHPHRL